MAWLTNRVASEIIRASHINTLISNIQQWAGNVSAFGNRLLNLGSPVDGTDAANKTYVDTQVATKADVIHSHDIASVTNLQTTLDGKAPTGHGHAIADVSGLQTSLDGKSNTGHGHAIADVSGLWTALDLKSVGVASSTANRVPVFANTGGKQLAQSLTEIQSDGSVNVPSGASFKIDGVPLSTGGSPSFASITGDPMDNANLAIELDNKSNLFHGHSFADITGTATPGQLGTGIPSASNFLRGDGSWQTVAAGGGTWGTIGGTLADQTDLQSALDAKAASSHNHDGGAITTGTVISDRLGSSSANGRLLSSLGSTFGGTWVDQASLNVYMGTTSNLSTSNTTAALRTHYHVTGNNVQITVPTSVTTGFFFIVSVKPGVTGTVVKRAVGWTHIPIQYVAEDLDLDVPGTYVFVYSGYASTGQPGWVVM